VLPKDQRLLVGCDRGQEIVYNDDWLCVSVAPPAKSVEFIHRNLKKKRNGLAERLSHSYSIMSYKHHNVQGNK